jgi:uncharacterized membrane protein YedE/YeeE
MDMNEFIHSPWPWYVAGPLIGLTVPLLLLIGNKTFGISSSMRHVCASCFPSSIPFFCYDWKKEQWNLYFVAGIFLGALLTVHLLADDLTPQINPKLTEELAAYGIPVSGIVPESLISFSNLLALQGWLVMVVGGFLVGFGTRYAGGCTSGHSIMGLSSLQLPSLIATCCFMLGGIVMANLILPFILKL